MTFYLRWKQSRTHGVQTNIVYTMIRVNRVSYRHGND